VCKQRDYNSRDLWSSSGSGSICQTVAIERRDTLYLVGFLVGATLLIVLGRGLVQGSAVAAWGLTFGGTTAVVVLGAALYRVQLELRASRRLLARREAELSFALEVQRALFPRRLPSGGGLEFAGVCIPAHGISGDYYDVIQLPDGRLAFAVADISGKGISAAILMANLQAVLRTLGGTTDSPSEVCNRLNRHLHQVTDESKFATFFYAEWNPRDGRLRYVNAGHYPPIFLGLDNGLQNGKKLDEGGPPLGLFRETAFQSGEVKLKPGDVLALYSDGITEATKNDGEEFGEERLKTVIAAEVSKPLREIQAAALKAVRSWSGSDPEDDMTLLIVRATDAATEAKEAR
jgi:phosphoserine phosphatase RsbU/P